MAKGDFAAAGAEANAIKALEGGDFTLLKSSGVPAQEVHGEQPISEWAGQHAEPSGAVPEPSSEAASPESLPTLASSMIALMFSSSWE